MIGFVNTLSLGFLSLGKKGGSGGPPKQEVVLRLKLGEPTRKCSSCKTHAEFSNTSLMDLYSSDETETEFRGEWKAGHVVFTLHSEMRPVFKPDHKKR